MHGALIVLLVGCAYRLGSPEVSWGDMEPVSVVQPSTDARRWYVPLESDALGPHVFFVDTGYSYTTCDDDFADKLGLRTRGRVKVRGELGHVAVTKARLPPLAMGGHQVEGLVCQVRDLDATSSIRDPREVPVAGVLGSDVLRRFHLVFDPERGSIELHDPTITADLPDDGDGIVRLRRELVGTRPRIPLVVEGEVVWPVVDTGASETYLDAERLGLTPDWQQENVTIRGTGGTGSDLRTLSYYDVQVSLAGYSVGEVTITGRSRGPMTPGLVGLDVLRHFRQEYDFDARRARFTPVAPSDLPSWHAWRRAPQPRLDAIQIATSEDGAAAP